MFDGLQGKLQAVFRDLRGEGRITPEVLEEALKQIRMALLEADVHFRVVKAFVDRVRERSSSEEVLASLTGSQQVVKIVRDELVALLGDDGAELRLDGRPAVVLLCGLQGSGKTTTAGKLAKRLHARGRHPLLVAGDLQRAAAVEQLVQVGRGVGVPVVTPEAGEKVEALADRALKVARDRGHDVLVFDTAGRLHVDEALMAEVKRLADRLKPSEMLFVADAMTGQDAVKSAGAFAAALPLTGAILTKLDGDSRGGAALSIRTVAKVPIRFAGTGEKSDDLELFQPERMASRILGMGDVLSLIERAERELDQGETRASRRPHRQRPAHSRGPARPDAADPQAGLDVADPRDAAQGGTAARARRHAGRRRPAQAGGGDHRLDDPARAAAAAGARRLAQEADRRRLRHPRAGDQPAAQAVPADAEDAQGRAGEDAAAADGTFPPRGLKPAATPRPTPSPGFRFTPIPPSPCPSRGRGRPRRLAHHQPSVIITRRSGRDQPAVSLRS